MMPAHVVHVSPETFTAVKRFEASCWKFPADGGDARFDDARWWVGIASMLPEGAIEGLPPGAEVQIAIDAGAAAQVPSKG